MSSPVFYPRYSIISAIAQGLQTVVTFSEDHDFTDGEIISFRISDPYGMVELNNKEGRVLSHTDDTVTVDIDSSTWTAFVDAGDQEQYLAMAVPSSSGIVPNSLIPQTNLQDAFDVRPS